MQNYNLNDVINSDLRGFCESVVHPFGNGALGAVCPDRYSDLILPCTDKLDFDITASTFSYGNSSTFPTSANYVGAVVWWMPRCLENGWAISEQTNYDTTSGEFKAADPVYKYIGIDVGAGQLDETVLLDLYTLCITGLWINGAGVPVAGIYDLTAPPNNPIFRQGYLAFRYSRFQSIIDNCDKARVLGAGVKLWSEQSPINTGGYCYGGWATQDDILNALFTSGGAPLFTFQDKMRYMKREPGLKGTTVRYSSLQTADQLDAEYPTIPARMYATKQNTDNLQPNTIIPVENSDLSVSDVCTPGTYIPIQIWRFNTTDGGDNNGPYTLKLSSTVHVEGTPSGNSPFQVGKITHDPMFENVQYFLENDEKFPVAVAGHSFKSFVSKAGKIVGKATKISGNIQKFLNLLEKAGE